MRRLTFTALYLLIFLLGVVFTLLNKNTVVVNFHLGQFELPVAVVVILAMFFGVILSLIVCYGAKLKYRVEVRGLRKKIDVQEQEIQNLRKIPLKGPP
jgi:uncharacterized integral membrane protein